MKKKIAIVLAGGMGKRMNSPIPKQYMDLCGKPVLYYSLNAFEQSDIDEIILVTGEVELEQCKENIVNRYGFHKVSHIVSGGKERYDSVMFGLKAIQEKDCIVYIHDGARPCISQDIIERCTRDVLKYHACVAAVPVKDTIKRANQKHFAVETPDRSTLWQIQTPQVFDYTLIQGAYVLMSKDTNKGNITDDAMVVEKYKNVPVKLSLGGYTNIKITTSEDLIIAAAFLENVN